MDPQAQPRKPVQQTQPQRHRAFSTESQAKIKELNELLSYQQAQIMQLMEYQKEYKLRLDETKQQVDERDEIIRQLLHGTRTRTQHSATEEPKAQSAFRPIPTRESEAPPQTAFVNEPKAKRSLIQSVLQVPVKPRTNWGKISMQPKIETVEQQNAWGRPKKTTSTGPTKK